MGQAQSHPVHPEVTGPRIPHQDLPSVAGDQGDLPPLATERGVRARLAAAGLRPQHKLGQNFLCHPGIMAALAEAAELTPDDQVLEIGAGLGGLTVELAQRARQVVAVEFDRDLLQLLPDELARQGLTNVSVVAGDIITLSDDDLILPASGRPFKVAANMPYYLTSPILERIHDQWPLASLTVLMIQEEVARRLVAPPGGEGYGVLSVLVQYYAEPELVRLVPPNAFWPRPEVRSAIVRLRRRPHPAVAGIPAVDYFALVKTAFGQRRKQIRNSLGGPPLGLSRAQIDHILGQTGIDGTRRAEDLTLAEFGDLAVRVAEDKPATREESST